MTIRIHEYSGKENGMMIIGTSSEIKNLGHDLINSCNNIPETEGTEWPRSLKEIEISNAPNYYISFNLETNNKNLPKGNGFQSETTKTIYFIFVIIGVFSSIKWLANSVL